MWDNWSLVWLHSAGSSICVWASLSLRLRPWVLYMWERSLHLSKVFHGVWLSYVGGWRDFDKLYVVPAPPNLPLRLSVALWQASAVGDELLLKPVSDACSTWRANSFPPCVSLHKGPIPGYMTCLHVNWKWGSITSPMLLNLFDPFLLSLLLMSFLWKKTGERNERGYILDYNMISSCLFSPQVFWK